MSNVPNLARNLGYHLSWIGAAVMYVIMQYFKSNDGDWVLGYIFTHTQLTTSRLSDVLRSNI